MFYKLSLIFLLAFLPAFAAEPVSLTGVSSKKADEATSLIMGYCNTAFIFATTVDTNLTSFTNCRAISCDSTGYARIAYISAGGDTIIEAKLLTGGVIYPIRNVVRLYHHYTGSTAGTVRSLTSAGVMTTNAIKLHK